MDGKRRGYWDKRYEHHLNRLVPFFDFFVFVSEDYKNNLLSYLPINAEKTVVVHNGADLGEFYRLDSQKHNVRVKVLCFSELDARPLRGLHYVIHAARRIVERNSDIGFSVIHGRNNKEYVDDPHASPMGRLIADLGLSEYFSFSSWIAPTEMNRFINQHDIILHPTFADACSNFILEGMACGKPIVATNGCGNDELIDRDNGILLEYESLEEDIVRAILRLAESKELRERMGKASEKKAKERFNLERESRETIEIYQDIARRRGLARDFREPAMPARHGVSLVGDP
jgi:glycosyltransferase involved in cell wall biosynthesis